MITEYFWKSIQQLLFLFQTYHVLHKNINIVGETQFHKTFSQNSIP